MYLPRAIISSPSSHGIKKDFFQRPHLGAEVELEHAVVTFSVAVLVFPADLL